MGVVENTLGISNMSTVAALMVFVFLLGMPIVTIAGALKICFSRHPVPTRLLRSVLFALALSVLLGPAIERGTAGSFALPWWLVGGRGEYYVWQYGVVILFITLPLCLLVEAVRALRRGKA